MNKENLIDLDKKQLVLLGKIIEQHVPSKTVWAYGSRVTWKATEISDLDLVVFDCNSAEISGFKEALEESDLLISVDVMDWGNISDNFKKNIMKKHIVLQEKIELEGWREMRFKEAARINPLESMSKGTKAKKVNMDALMPFSRKIYGYVDGTYKGGSKFRNGDTLLARITPCLENGKTAFVDFLETDEMGFGSTEFIVIREKVNITDKGFLYYFAISMDFRETAIKSMTGTSGRQRVELDEILKYKFNLPPLPEQESIAEVLSSLDDKIDLLHRQNKTLEDMAQTIFRQWFVEEADEGWEEVVLGDLIELRYGKGLKKSLRTPGLFPVVGSGGIVDYHSGYIVEGPGIVVGRKGTLGKVIYLSGNFYPIDTTYFVKPKPNIGYTFLYFLLKSINFKEMNSDSAVPGLNRDIALSIDVKLPAIDKILEFERITEPIFAKLSKNKSKIFILENLRDTLLPKLMSGVVRVTLHAATLDMEG